MYVLYWGPLAVALKQMEINSNKKYETLYIFFTQRP